MPPSIRPAHPQQQRLFLRLAADFLRSIITVSLLAFIFSMLIGRFQIEQTSMEPSLHPGERVLVNQSGSVLHLLPGDTAHASSETATATALLRRGQVVVFYETPENDGIPLIKRLIGLPGDTIEIRDGIVHINGHILHEPYLHGVSTLCATSCGPFTLGTNEYFFMGDNRSGSRDSRHFGPVTAEQIIGQVILRYWPLDQFSLEL